MQNNEIVILVVGCIVFFVTLASAFLALIASDFPNEPEKKGVLARYADKTKRMDAAEPHS